MKLFISVSAQYDEKTVKKQLALRKTYEKLKKAANPGGYQSGTPSAKRKFIEWKKAHQNYPKVASRILEKRLRGAQEKADPKLKAARKAAEKKAAENMKVVRALAGRLSRLEQILADLNDKDFDYTPDDVDDPAAYKADIKKQVAALKRKIRSLRS